MKEYQIVISRYNEDLSWLDIWSTQFDILVYNKGEQLKDNKNYKCVNLPNYGREAHTYLYHIVNNYDDLNYKGIIFLQGKIDDLGICVFDDLNQYVHGIESNGFSASNCCFYNESMWNDIDLSFLKDIKLSDLRFRDYLKKYLGEIPKNALVSWKGCFGVSKDRILSRERKFYDNLLQSFPKYDNVEEGHYLERMWGYIFTQNGLDLRGV